ncbi:MAG: hypothetical protein Q8K75_02690 [Chlamydiales bacterium]|nr:hypothetical protein [Chlamydiales bacterium]
MDNMPPINNYSDQDCAHFFESVQSNLEKQGSLLIGKPSREACNKVIGNKLFSITLVVSDIKTQNRVVSCYLVDKHTPIKEIKHRVADLLHMNENKLDAMFSNKLAKDTDNMVDAFNCNGRGGEQLKFFPKWGD